MKDTENLINALVEAKPVIAGFSGDNVTSSEKNVVDKIRDIVNDIEILHRNRSIDSESYQEKVTRTAALLLCDLSEESKELPSVKKVVVALGKCNKLIPPSKNKYEW